MKLSPPALCVTVLLLSCNGTPKQRSVAADSQAVPATRPRDIVPTPAARKAVYQALYTDEFKLVYFRQLLRKSYNNSAAVQEIIKHDHSGCADPILSSEDYNLIDSLTTADNQLMKQDSAQAISRAAEGAEGKHTLGFVLARYDSEWLDSLAREHYKLYGAEMTPTE